MIWIGTPLKTEGSSMKRLKIAYSPPASELPGQQTYVREKDDTGSGDKDRSPDSVLSPDKATPRSPTRPDSNKEDNIKHLGPTNFNVPDGSADEIKSRTRPAEGEQYGHPYNDQTTNVRIKKDRRTASVERALEQQMIQRVASAWIKEAVIRVRERPHVKSKGLFNTRYKQDRPKSQQNQHPNKNKLKKKRYYRRNKAKIKRKNNIRYKRKYKNNQRWKKVQQRRKDNPTKHVRKSPNKSLLKRNRKKHQKNYKNRQKSALLQRIVDRYLLSE
jgi:hypothetical protein